MAETAIEKCKNRLASGQTTVLVFYRGERSFFCRQWLRRWLTIPALDRRLELADVVILFTTSQSQGKAFSVADQIAGQHSLLDRRLFFFGDPEHLLVNYLTEQGISKPVITNPDSHRAHGWVFDFGMVQPAVVAITADSTVVYDWTSKPSLLNVAGKLDRPDPWDVWDCIERRLDRIRISKSRALRFPSLPPPDRLLTTHPSQQLPSAFLPSPASLQHETYPPSTPGPVVEHLQPLDSPHLMSTVEPVHQTDTYMLCNDDPSQLSKSEVSGSHQVLLDGDNAAAPRSTSIDTFVYPGTNFTLLQEDLEISQTNLIANVRLPDLSAKISALATNLLANQPNYNMPTAAHSSLMSYDHDKLHCSALPERGRSPFYYSAQKDANSSIAHHSQSPTPIDGIHSQLDNDGEDVSNNSTEDTDCVDSDENQDNIAGQCALAPLEIGDFQRPPGMDIFSKATTAPRVDYDFEPHFIDDLKSDGIKPDRRPDLDRPLLTEPIETSVASAGSDQVDSTNVTMKHASIRTDDSSQLHSMQCDSTSFSSDRRIPEEADDCKPGVSDHLRELKDPSPRSYFRSNRREDAENFGAALSYQNVDRLIPEPQTMIMDKTSFDIMTNTGLYSGTAGTKNPASLLHTSTFPSCTADVSLSAGIGNTMPLSANMMEAPTIPRPGRNLQPERGTTVSSFVSNQQKCMDRQRGSDAISIPRDEYEAYDEYVVCEYQVEEQVEEYESDSMSRSRGFMTTLLQEGRGPARSSSLRDIHREVFQDVPRAPDMNKNGANRQGGSTLAAMSSAPTLSPGVEACVLEWRHAPQDSMGGSQMRRVLRKIKVPIMAVRRKVGGKGQQSTTPDTSARNATQERKIFKTDAATTENEARLRKKDQQRRGMLRKRPGHLKIAGSLQSPVGVRPDDRPVTKDLDGDEQSAKLGRKETFRSVFRKIPMPKNRRRASTGGGATAALATHVEPEREARVGRYDDDPGHARKASSGYSGNKPGPLQSVLQRLPSLNGTLRDQRFNLVPEPSQEKLQTKEFVKSDETLDNVESTLRLGHLNNNAVSTIYRGTSASHHRPDERIALSNPFAISESPLLKREPLLPLKQFDGDVHIAGPGRTFQVEGSPTGSRQHSLERTETETARHVEPRSVSSKASEAPDECGKWKGNIRTQHANTTVPKIGWESSNYDSDGTDEWGRRLRRRQFELREIVSSSLSSPMDVHEKLGRKGSFASASDRLLTQSRWV